MLAWIAALDTRNYLRVRGEYVDRDRGSMRRGNYLRVRGEYTTWREDLSAGLELPPRARRILRDGQRDLENRGTTSACAENTTCILFTPHPARNYLRVRGEYAYNPQPTTTQTELPPRARRILGANQTALEAYGTTSACAENTHRSMAPFKPPRNYLRVRGEYFWKRGAGSLPWELPPRARRIPPF